jgi:hypothetical protein
MISSKADVQAVVEDTNMKSAVLAATCISSILLLTCGSKELTRAKAKDIIEASDLYKLGKKRVMISAEEVNKLTSSGYLTWEGFGVQNLSVTKAGQQYFESASGHMMMFGMPGIDPFTVVPVTPMRPKVVEITGIAGESPNIKAVEYRWQWDSSTQAQELKTILPALTAITAEKVIMQLYDDGWRAQFGK